MRAVHFKRKSIKKWLSLQRSEDEAAQGSPSQVGTHTVPLWFARTAVTASTEEKISAAGHCSEEEFAAYRSTEHP